MHTDHCENCGSTDYEDLHTGDQGYTACCNEPICSGHGADRWTDGTTTVTACCSAHARPKMASAGGQPGFWRAN